METWTSRIRPRRLAAALAGAGILTGAGPALALGTPAGSAIESRATADYAVGGVATQVQSAPVRLAVDEILEVAVVADDAGPVPVLSPASGAFLTFTLANTGNGTESFRLVADGALPGDDFDVTTTIHLERNGTPGLQSGPGGDELYIPGAGDPALAADATQVVYVAIDVPAGGAESDSARVGLRAVAGTLLVAAGTDDPADPGFPVPGTAYPGAGDAGPDGGVIAVVGTAYGAATAQYRAEGAAAVTASVVIVEKSVRAIVDPLGGSTVVPGTVVEYEIQVSVAGGAVAAGLTVTDPLPAALEYVPGSLVVSSSGALPPGEDPDDDLLPAGVDGTGFDAAAGRVVVSFGDVAATASPHVFTFQTRVR